METLHEGLVTGIKEELEKVKEEYNHPKLEFGEIKVHKNHLYELNFKGTAKARAEFIEFYKQYFLNLV